MEIFFLLVGLLAAINGILFYISTFAGVSFDIAQFYGFYPDYHLMRNTGVLLLMIGALNIFVFAKRGIYILTE